MWSSPVIVSNDLYSTLWSTERPLSTIIYKINIIQMILLSLSLGYFEVDLLNAEQPGERPTNQWSNILPSTSGRPQCNLFERPCLGPL